MEKNGLTGGEERLLGKLNAFAGDNASRGDFLGLARWKIFQTLFSVHWALIGATIILLLVLWFTIGPRKTSPDASRRKAAEVAAASIRDVLREHRGEFRTLTCVPFRDDSTDAVFTAVYDALRDAGTFDVRRLTVLDRARGAVGMSYNAFDSEKRAVSRARWQKSDAALVGAVKNFERHDGDVSLVVEYRLLDVSAGTEAYLGTYDSAAEARLAAENAAAVDDPAAAEIDAAAVDLQTAAFPVDEAVASDESAAPAPGAAAKRSGRTRNFIGSFLLWFFAFITIPLVGLRQLEAAAAKRSNAANFVALFVCCALDLLFGWLLLTPFLHGTAGSVATIILVFGAFNYNLKMLHLAHQRTEPVGVYLTK